MNIRKIIKEEIQDTDIISTEVQTLYVTGLGCTVDSLFFRQDDYFNCVKDYGEIVLKRYAIQAVEIKGNEMDWA